MPRKTNLLFFYLCIPSSIASPFWYHRTDPGPGPTSVLITSAPSLPPTGLQNRNAVRSLPRFCDGEPCVAIKIIHGVTTTSPCEGQTGCITYAKSGLMEIPPTFVTAVKSTTTPPIKESTSSKNTFTWLDEATTFYVYVTEAIKPTSSRSAFSATTLATTSTTAPGATGSLVSSILLPVNSPYTTGVAKTSSAQSHGTRSGILQPSASTGSVFASSKPTLTETISTTPSSHLQPLPTRLSSSKATLKLSNTPTSASTIPRSALPPTHGLTSSMYEVSANPVATHPPTLLKGVDRISSVITDISLLMSILTATEASTLSLGSMQTTKVEIFTLPTLILPSPPATTHISSAAPAPLPALGIAGISSVITDITLLESILAATLTSARGPAGTQTTTKASMLPSSHPLAPLDGKKSITSTRTITRTASPLTVVGGPKLADNPLWGTGKTAVECACQCKGQRFNLTVTRPD